MVNSISLAHALLLHCIRSPQHIAAHSISPIGRVEEMEGSLEEDYEIMAHFMEQGFDDPSFKVPVWSSATADSSSSYCYYYPPEVENFDSYGGFCAPHFGHGDGFYLNESDVIPQNSEPAICVTAIGDLARFNDNASSDDIGQPVPPPQDPAICVTAIGDLAHFSEDASSDDIGQPVPPQDPMLQIKRKRRDSNDDASSKTSRKAQVSWNVSMKSLSFEERPEEDSDLRQRRQQCQQDLQLQL